MNKNKSSAEFKKYATKHLGFNSLALHDYESKMNNGLFMPVGMTPNIIEERKLNVIAMDVFSRLMIDRILFLGSAIDDYVSNVVCAQLLFLQSVDSKKDINLYVNSPGGSVSSGLAIVDVMGYISNDVATTNMGMSASMGAVILCCGEKGKRFSLPHARTMIHQPMGGAEGQSSDMEITVNEIKKLKRELYELISKSTGKKYEQVEKDSDRDYWMTAQEAKDYGMIDKILEKRKGK